MYTLRENIAINLELISKANFVKYHQICSIADRNRRKKIIKTIPKPSTLGVTTYIYIYITCSSISVLP